MGMFDVGHANGKVVAIDVDHWRERRGKYLSRHLTGLVERVANLGYMSRRSQIEKILQSLREWLIMKWSKLGHRRTMTLQPALSK
jgi:hypothetical protein